MANRGRGRGKSIQLSGDQGLFNKAEILPPILQPPPNFPPLEHKPMPTVVSNEWRYMLQLKKDYAEFMKDSSYYIPLNVVKKDIDRFSDRQYQDSAQVVPYDLRFDWCMMPGELKPKIKRKKSATDKSLKNKKLKEVDIDSKLKELENKENVNASDAEEEDKDEEDSEKDVDEKMEDEEEEMDEEMDEGTDYVNNYFDNGENYEDDEDNADDGAIF